MRYIKLNGKKIDDGTGYVEIAISPKYRHRGIAEKLMNQMISDMTKKESKRRIQYNADIDNIPSQNFAQKYGFKLIQTTPARKSYMYPVSIQESWFFSDKDLYYNIDAFKYGETNLGIIVGFSGAGKSTLSVNFDDMKDLEKIELDDVILRASQWMMDIKKAPLTIREFYESDGARFIMSPEEFKKKYDRAEIMFTYYKEIYETFISWIQEKTKRSNKQFLLNGIWPLCFEEDPIKFKDWCIIIKGTSFITASIRATKRDASKNLHGWVYKLGYFLDRTIGKLDISKVKYIMNNNLKVWREYFSQDPTRYYEESAIQEKWEGDTTLKDIAKFIISMKKYDFGILVPGKTKVSYDNDDADDSYYRLETPLSWRRS